MRGNRTRPAGTALALALALPAGAVAEQTSEAAPGPPATLSLAGAVEQALARNDRLEGLRDAREQAVLGVRLAQNDFRPKLVPNILGSFGQSDVSNQTYRLDLRQKFVTGTEVRASVGTASARNQLGNYYNTDTTFLVSQPLLRGFGKNVARRQLTAAEIQRADAARAESFGEQQVTVDVARAYYQVVAQKQLVAVATKSLERARRLLEASEAKLAAGRVSQLDVLRARQLVTQAEGQLLDAGGAVDDAKDQLRHLIGQELDYDFEVVLDIPRVQDPVSREQAEALALQQRPELPSAEAAAADAERAVRFSRNQLLPQLDLNVAVTRREVAESFLDSFQFDRFEVATFFAISLPLDRTADNIQYHNALIERDRRKRELRAARMRVVEEARRAVRQQERLGKALEVAEASVEFAARELEVAQLRYERGLSNNLDVVTAEGNLLGAESRRIAMLAELAVARLSLRATLGVLDPRKDLGPKPPGT